AIGRTRWPIQLTPTTEALLSGLSAVTGLPADDPDALAQAAGPAEAFLRSTFRTTTNPTGLTAGYKHNVIPEHAEALIDVRVIPGTEDHVLAELQRIVGEDIVIETVVRDIGMETAFEGDLVDSMV